MYKLAALLLVGLALNFGWQEQDEPPPNPEMQRQEIINLENEAARAIQTNTGTFFRRVYSDDFAVRCRTANRSIRRALSMRCRRTKSSMTVSMLRTSVCAYIKIPRSPLVCGRRGVPSRSRNSIARCV